MLFDRGSDSGTWVHIKHSYSQHQNWLLPNLLLEGDRVFRAGDNQFVFIQDNSTRLNQVDMFFNLPHLREVALCILNQLKQKGFKSIQELLKGCSKSQFKESGAKREEVEQALVAFDKLKQLFANRDLKTCSGLHLKFTSGPNKGKMMMIDGTRMIFGSA